MKTNAALEHDYIQDDLIRSVLYAFAMSDYEGSESVSMKSVSSSEILHEVESNIINEALSTAQLAGLISWDDDRIGALRLTSLGIQKFHLVRKDFFDEDENRRLSKAIKDIKFAELADSGSYRQIKDSCNGLGAWSQEICPVSGQWIARRLSDMTLYVVAGSSFPIPEYDEENEPVIWYLLK